MNLFLADFDPSFLVFLLFLLMPLLGRVLRGLGGEKAGKAKPKAPKTTGRGRASESEPDVEAGEVSELERRGREAWKRLMEGLEPEGTKTPEVVHVPEEKPQPVAPPKPLPPKSQRGDRIERAPLDRGGLPSQIQKPQPQAKPKPKPQPEPVVVAAGVQDAPTGTGDQDYGFASAATVEFATQTPTAPARVTRKSGSALSGAPTREALRRAVVWSEILRPPLALRSPGESDTRF